MIGTILSIAAIVVLIFFGLRLLKSIIIFKVLFRVISLVFIILIIVVAVSAYYIIKDANDYAAHFMKSKNLFVLANDDVISAFELDNTTYRVINNLSFVSDSYRKYEFTNINDEYYKIMLIRIDALDFVKGVDIKEIGINLTGQQMKEVLLSDAPKDTLANVTSNEGIKSLTISDAELKNYLFNYIITYLYNPKNINILLSNIRSGNVQVYEETALFKSIKFVPSVFMKDITSKGNSTIFS